MSETTVTFLDYNTVSSVYTPSVRVFNLEITQQAASVYAAAMEQLRDALSAVEADVNDTDSIDTALTILGNLDAWSKYLYVEGGVEKTNDTLGIPDYNNSNGGNPILVKDLGTMDRYMAENVDRLIRTLRAAGCDPISKTSFNSDSLSFVFQKLLINDKNTYGIDAIVSNALAAAQQARIVTNVWTQSDSIQQLLMVDYITRGNTLLYDQMSGLKTAIDINQSTLTYLNSLQDLMNQKDPEHFILALQDLSGDISIKASDAYSTFEKDTFNQELSNVPKFTSDTIRQFLSSGAGVSSTAEPPIDQTTGVALGAFQNISGTQMTEEQMYSILQTYLNSKGEGDHTVSLITSPSSLPTPGIHGQIDYNVAVTATIPGASDEDKTTWWRAFFAVNHTYTTDADYAALINDPSTQTAFAAYVQQMAPLIIPLQNTDPPTSLINALGSYYSSQDPPRLLTLSTTLTFPGLTGGTDYLAVLNTEVPPDKFTDAERLKIWQVFMVGEGYKLGGHNESGFNPDLNSLATQANFKAYFTQIQDILFDRSIDTRLNRILQNLQYLMDQIQLQAGDDGKPLKDQLQIVYNDFNNISKNSGSVSDWVKDYNTGNVGGYQKNLNNTIVASQSLNDTKSEELKNVMFIYEEFYKSATAMLSSLQQLLVKLAGAISR